MSGPKNGWVRGTWLLVAGLSLAATACRSGEESAEAAAAPAEARPVRLGAEDVTLATTSTVDAGVVITGTLQPAFLAKVKAQVPGTVVRVGVDRGTAVAQGQALATIEAAGVTGQAAAAEANLALARQRLESAKTLRDAGALSAIDYQAAQAAYEAAQAQAAGAREMAERATVRSPIAGVVGDRTVEEGEAVGMNDPLFTVVRSDVLELSGSVPVDAAAQIRPGQAVVFTLAATPDRELRGDVARIEPVADPSTRQVGVYLRLRNPGNVIAGQFATGRVLGGGARSTAIVVPETAVRGAGADTYVFLIEGGTAVKRAVTLGEADAAQGTVAIVSGLDAGAQVITAPTAAIAEGAKVQVAGPATPPAAAPATGEGK